MKAHLYLESSPPVLIPVLHFTSFSKHFLDGVAYESLLSSHGLLMDKQVEIGGVIRSGQGRKHTANETLGKEILRDLCTRTSGHVMKEGKRKGEIFQKQTD